MGDRQYKQGESITVKNRKNLQECGIVVSIHNMEEGTIVDSNGKVYDINEEFEILGGLLCG